MQKKTKIVVGCSILVIVIIVVVTLVMLNKEEVKPLSSFEYKQIDDSDGQISTAQSGTYTLGDNTIDYTTPYGDLTISRENILYTYTSSSTNNTFAILLNQNEDNQPFFEDATKQYLYLFANSGNYITEYASSSSLQFKDLPQNWIHQSTGEDYPYSYNFS